MYFAKFLNAFVNPAVLDLVSMWKQLGDEE